MEKQWVLGIFSPCILASGIIVLHGAESEAFPVGNLVAITPHQHFEYEKYK